MARQYENTGFVCVRCHARVLPVTNGSYRNHCPKCLWSLHVDAGRPGDRASDCGGLMRPLYVNQSKKGWQVLHRCCRCGKRQPNILALGTQQDDLEALLEFMRSLSSP